MTNRTISIIFMVVSWVLLAMTAVLGWPLFIIYALVCVYLSAYVYHKQDNGTMPGPRIRP